MGVRRVCDGMLAWAPSVREGTGEELLRALWLLHRLLVCGCATNKKVTVLEVSAAVEGRKGQQIGTEGVDGLTSAALAWVI